MAPLSLLQNLNNGALMLQALGEVFNCLPFHVEAGIGDAIFEEPLPPLSNLAGSSRHVMQFQPIRGTLNGGMEQRPHDVGKGGDSRTPL